MKIPVKLQNYEVIMAATVGSRRQLTAIMKQSKPRFSEQYPGQLHDNHIRAAMAEMAVAKHLNCYWGGHFDTYTSLPDVGEFEVRYSLLPYAKVKDDDSGIVISVAGTPPDMVINGWIDTDTAKQACYRKDFGNGGPPAYFVPHERLNSMQSLRVSPEMQAAQRLGYR